MKLLVPTLLLFSSIAFSQTDCSKLLKSENYSGTQMTSSREPVTVSNAAKETVTINWVHGNNLMLVLKSSAQLKCVGTDANMDIHFIDGTKLSVKHMGKMNCEGNFVVFLGEVFQNQAVVEKLKANKVKKVAVTYSDVVDGKIKLSVEDYILSNEQAEVFNQTLKCITTK